MVHTVWHTFKANFIDGLDCAVRSVVIMIGKFTCKVGQHVFLHDLLVNPDFNHDLESTYHAPSSKLIILHEKARIGNCVMVYI